MHIAIISDFGHVSGGAAKVAIESARGLADAGIRVTFIYAIAPLAPVLEHPLIENLHLPFANVWTISGKADAARKGIWNSQAGQALKEALAERQSSLTAVHLHQWSKAFSPAVIAAAGLSGLPVFFTLHEYFSFCPEGIYFNHRTKKACTLAPMSMSCIGTNCDRDSYAHKLVRVARTAAIGRAFRRCPNLTFIHVSDYARRFAEPHLPKWAHHVTLENMIDVEKEPPANPAAHPHVLFMGRFVAEKGPHLLAAAARQAGMPVRFVGDGPMKDAIRAANPEAEITGWVSGEKVAAEIASARALALPSLWFEPGPLTIGEAMARGVCVIVSREMGADAIIKDGVEGCIVPAGDIAALERALRQLADPAIAAKFGLAAYQAYWRDPLTIERHRVRLIAAYSKTTSSVVSRAA